MTPKLLRDILGNIWISEVTPASWTTGLIVKLPKKGDLSDCNNWRGITLLSITSKILSRIIHKRLADALMTNYCAMNKLVSDQEDLVQITYYNAPTVRAKSGMEFNNICQLYRFPKSI